jgi:hypothetical protein
VAIAELEGGASPAFAGETGGGQPTSALSQTTLGILIAVVNTTGRHPGRPVVFSVAVLAPPGAGPVAILTSFDMAHPPAALAVDGGTASTSRAPIVVVLALAGLHVVLLLPPKIAARVYTVARPNPSAFLKESCGNPYFFFGRKITLLFSRLASR